ncbi:hypothetical protein VNO78_04261 [Psophocarpus tetragonolobus]|uniref:Uncharacterized protein n=1 Tax=Psophocarpus tetragonolobus TaxID=3891 RepID=A0AAN9T2S9_PSOTE
MASKSNNKIPPGHTLFRAIPRRRKHRNPGIAVAFRHSAGNNSSPLIFCEGLEKREASARKLAAELWQWRGHVFRHAPSLPSSQYPIQHANRSVKITLPRHHNSGEKRKEIKDQQMKPITILRSRNGLLRELESSVLCLKCSTEEATKWNPTLNNEALDKFTVLHDLKYLADKKIVGECYFGVTNLLELLRVQRSINELKATQKSFKKRLEQLLQNLENKRNYQKGREWQRIETVLDNLKDKLGRERRSRERMELFNTKLVHELAKVNLSAKHYMTKYKKEKKERRMIEEVCNELAIQVREDTAKLEGLLSDSVKICKEVEEEREMMEMADLWREERVQMKLADAQFLLEDKYNQMVQLVTFLQMFLISRGAELDTSELEDAQLIKQAVESVNIKSIVELSYDFSKSDDTVFSTFEELRKDNTQEGMIKPGSFTPFNSPLSTIHIESLDEEVLNKSSTMHQNSPSRDYNIGLELINSSETVGYIEDQKFSSKSQRGDTYSVNVNQDKDILVSEAEYSEKACLESSKRGVNGACSVSIGDIKRKVYLSSKQLRSHPKRGITNSSTKYSKYKRLGDGWHKQKECNNNLPTSSFPEGSQCQISVEDGFKHSELLEQGKSTYKNRNPHIIRGIRGCTEWPRGITKSNLKATPSEKE